MRSAELGQCSNITNLSVGDIDYGGVPYASPLGRQTDQSGGWDMVKELGHWHCGGWGHVCVL